MNESNRFLEELESAKVRFESLSDLAHISTGTQLNRSLLASTGGFAVINGGVAPSGFHTEFNTSENTIAISQGGASAGHVTFMREKFWAGAHCYVVIPQQSLILNKFLFYVLKNSQARIQASKIGAGIPGLSRGALSAVKVPVPSLDVQQKIVDILDIFTELDFELTAELEARKKQYEVYRAQFFSALEQRGVSRKPMGGIARIRNGSDWKRLSSGTVPVYGSGGIMTNVGASLSHGPSVLIPRKGSLGNLFYVEGPFWTVDTCFFTEIDTSVCLPKYLFYFLKTKDLNAMNVAGGVPSLTQTQLNKISVPIPTLEEQQRIVETLDKFDLLVHDTAIGLPAEINARRKQYEYYRDKLLSFKALEGH